MPGVHRYGPGPDQFLELTLPDADAPAPVVVVVHGGFWRPAYGIELARPLAADVARAGFAAVSVEYRRVGQGNPQARRLAVYSVLYPLDLDKAPRTKGQS